MLSEKGFDDEWRRKEKKILDMIHDELHKLGYLAELRNYEPFDFDKGISFFS